jgi:uncharacterized protein YdiU (UPF0061 family)
MPPPNKRPGIALMIVIVIIGTAALIIALNASLLGLGELQFGYTSQQGSETLSLADGCVEETFRRLQLDRAYPGGSLTVDGGSCLIDIFVCGLNRIITVQSVIGAYHKSIRMDVDISSNNEILVTSWEEI